MRWTRSTARSPDAAGAWRRVPRWARAGLGFVVALAAVVAVAETTAAAAPRSASLATAGAAGAMFDARAQDRPVDERRGPFFGLRVHSMDVAGNAENVACFEYVLDGLRPSEGRQRYDLVRTLYRVDVRPSASDEVMGLPLPRGADVRALRGWMGQTRWMRRIGPGGTPVGGFVGRLQIAAAVGVLEREVAILDVSIAGTTGLRPMRGDPDDATSRSEGRATAPLHDEGWYVGRVPRRALVAYAREVGDEDGVLRMLRTLDGAVLAGTFEGHLTADDAASGRTDYRTISHGAWWFDGVLAWNGGTPRRATAH